MRISLKICTFCVVLFCVSTLAADSVRVTRRNVDLDSWKDAFRSLRVALISDLHLTKDNFQESPFPELPACLAKEEPDLILIGGDIFHTYAKPEEFADAFCAWIRKFPAAKYGIYAVLGNHDMNNGEKKTRDILESAGIVTLRNSGVRIRVNGEAFSLLGARESWNETNYLSDTFRKMVEDAAPCILLAHRPIAYPQISADSPVLVLAGHNHGGLVHLPGVPRGAVVKLFSKDRSMEYVYGWYAKGKKCMFVTAGLGGAGHSDYRVNNPPEVVLLTFRKGN